MVHGVEPLLPFDITLATFLVPNLTKPLDTADLIATCARQLEMHDEDLDAIHDNVLKSRLASVRQFEKQYQNTILAYNFKPGNLVLVRNSGSDLHLGCKTKPRYVGPMVVIRRTPNSAYRLTELDGAVSKLRYAAFCIVPYFSCSRTSIPVTCILAHKDLVAVVQDTVDDINDAEQSDDQA